MDKLTRVNSALNVLRAAAAAMVCVVHVRGYLLVPLAEADVGVLGEAAYVLTSLGNGAVMVFFVLSGYFVGGSVLRQGRDGTFRWRDYLLVRGIRLWIVLLPALILTLALDRMGMFLYPDSPAYDLDSRAVHNGSLMTFTGNIFFLQSWVVEPYGSNGALWSLAYEWAYYLLFPLIVIAIGRKDATWLGRAAGGVAAAGVAFIAGPTAIVLFVAWLLGALVAWKRDMFSRAVSRVAPLHLNALRLIVAALTLGAMVLDRLQDGGPNRAVAGTMICAFFAAILVVLFVDDVQPRFRPLRAVVGFVDRTLAESSYSLYAFHMPVLLLFATALTPTGPTNRFAPDGVGWLLVVATTLGLILGGWVFARLTEFHYRTVRDAVRERLVETKNARI